MHCAIAAGRWPWPSPAPGARSVTALPTSPDHRTTSSARSWRIRMKPRRGFFGGGTTPPTPPGGGGVGGEIPVVGGSGCQQVAFGGGRAGAPAAGAGGGKVSEAIAVEARFEADGKGRGLAVEPPGRGAGL